MRNLLSFVCALILATSLHAQMSPSFFGMTINHATWNPPTPWPKVGFSGVRLWDTSTSWAEIEPSKGVYDWAQFDAWLALAKTHNVDVIYTFGSVPCWAAEKCAGEWNYGPPKDLRDWDEFVRAVVARANGRIQYYEIWNEPNVSGDWTDRLGTLLELARHAYKTVKEIDPKAQVLTPSPSIGHCSSGSYETPQCWFADYLKAGGGCCADVIAFHGYLGEHPDTGKLLSFIAEIRSVLNSRGESSKPLWDTEFSWGDSSSTADPAAFLARATILQASAGIQRMYWYAWDNGKFGTLWRRGEGVLPAGSAYDEVQRWLVGGTFISPCKCADKIWVCTLVRTGGDPAIIAWAQGGSGTYTPLPKYTTRTDLSGRVGRIATPSILLTPRPELLETGRQ